jgi:Methyltransferase domain
MLFRILDTIKAVLRRPGYRQYLWAKLCRRPINVGAEMLRLYLPIEKRSIEQEFSAVPRGHALPKVRDMLFKESPYAGFIPEDESSDLQGWASDDPILEDAIRLLQPGRICEIGSWKGRSAVHMARVVKKLNLSTEIVCVDTWLGSAEHWLRPNWYEWLRVQYGYPRLYYTFLGNIVREQLADIVTPFPTTSDNAAVVFKQLNIRFDIAYIDAAHEYEPAKRDLATYYALLSDDGLLIADDYGMWPSVTKAVDDFVRQHRLRCISKTGKAIIPKGTRYRAVSLR